VVPFYVSLELHAWYVLNMRAPILKKYLETGGFCRYQLLLAAEIGTLRLVRGGSASWGTANLCLGCVAREFR
jgi:hypothetical protein